MFKAVAGLRDFLLLAVGDALQQEQVDIIGIRLQRHGGVLGGFGPVLPEQVNPGSDATGRKVARIEANRLVGVGERPVELSKAPPGAGAQDQQIDLGGRHREAAGGVGNDPGPVALFGVEAGSTQTKVDLEGIEQDGLGEIIESSHWVVQFPARLATGVPQRSVQRLGLQHCCQRGKSFRQDRCLRRGELIYWSRSFRLRRGGEGTGRGQRERDNESLVRNAAGDTKRKTLG